MNRPIVSTIVVGGITSLIIEVTQAFLPTRDSGMTDLITNTSGTALGAILYRLEFTRILLAKFEVFAQSLFKKSVHVSVERR
jgi:glycopeptide antibiotics resistance protein